MSIIDGDIEPLSVTDSDRYHTIRRFLWPNEPVPQQSPSMGAGGIDADLMEYVHWARSIRGLSDNTIRVRLDFLQRLHTFIGLPLRDAEPGHLLRFERIAIGGRAPETRRAYVCHIRAFYRWAHDSRIVTEDPSTLLTLPVIPRHLPRPIDEDDLAVALNAARPKMRAILTLGAFAGLRSIEIAGLDWSDLRRETDGAAFIHVRKGKGGKERMVEVGQMVIMALQAYGIKRRGPMFLGLDGRQIDAKSVSRSANRHLARHGVEATMHQLRHRYGTIAYQLSHDLRMVQEQMGHASPQTTAGYTRASAEAAARMVAAMDDMEPARPPPDRPSLVPRPAVSPESDTQPMRSRPPVPTRQQVAAK
jgi:integrase/recombinase XerC